MKAGDGGGTGCFEIKIRTNTAKLANVRITRFRQCRDLIRRSETFIKDKVKIASRMGGICVFYYVVVCYR